MNRSHGAVLATCAALLCVSSPAATAQTVGPLQQAARDDERVRILHEELARERASLQDAAKQTAERLAAGDSPGADAARQRQLRTSRDIEALEREIGQLRRRARVLLLLLELRFADRILSID